MKFKISLNRWVLAIALAVVWVIAHSASAQNISYFRHDHGVANGTQSLPDDFSKDAVLRWRTPLHSGHSTPCVCGDSIFVSTYNTSEKELAVIALDRVSGTIRWKRTVPAKSIESVHATGSPASSTPACNGTHVFAFFGSYGMLCFDWNGSVIWEQPMGPFQDEFGAASSPILVDDKVILNQDHDLNNFIMAMDQRTGQTVWKVGREDTTRSYSTPIVLDRNGSKQILVAGSLQLAAYDPKSGEKIWWYNGISRIVDCTPTIQDGLIYVATWTPGGDAGERLSMEPFAQALANYDKNSDGLIGKNELPANSPVLDRFFRIDLNQNQQLDEEEWKRHAVVFEKAQNVAVALEPGSRGPLAPQYVRWTFDRGLPTVPSSVVYDGVLTMVKDSGIVTLLDIKSGKMLYQGRAQGRGNYYASLVAGDGKVYLTSESGVMTVLHSGKEGKTMSSHDFGERIMATPVISDGKFYIRTENALYCYEKAPR